MLRPRRIVAGVLVVLGAVLMLAAPESAGTPETLSGGALIVLGILVELIGITLERR